MGMVQLYRISRPWVKWTGAVSLLLWILIMSVFDYTDQAFSGGYMIFLPIWLASWAQARRLILAGPVLLVRHGVMVERVPLAAAEIKPLKQGWHARWMDGRRGRKVTLESSAEFRLAVEQAAETARQADPATVPLTEREANRAVPMVKLVVANPMFIWLVVGIVAFIGLAVWLNTAVALLPVVGLALLADRVAEESQVLLLDQHLYLLSTKGEIHPIPLEAVQGVQPSGRSEAVILTRDPAYPVLKVQRFVSQQDFVGLLQRRLAGEPAPEPRPEPAVTQTQGQARCSLCGRPEPGAVPGGGVIICERCSGRTRHEALETGRGLGGKEPKPM